MGETRFFGYKSDAEYREAVAKEIAEQEAESRESKPVRETAAGRESARESADDLLVQAAGKLTQALGTHRDELGVNDAYGTLQQMLEHADVEDAALAVAAFASEHPSYAPHAVDAFGEIWGEFGDDVLADVVQRLSYAEVVQAEEQAQEAFDKHVAHRADVIRDLSEGIAAKDGEAVRNVTAAMAQGDETMLYGDDVQATANLLGHRAVAKQGEASVGKSEFLAAFDDAVERDGLAGRLHSDAELEKHRREQAAANAELTSFDYEDTFERGRADGFRRVQQSLTPFGEEFEAELQKYDPPEWATPEAIRARNAKEAREKRERFGEPQE